MFTDHTSLMLNGQQYSHDQLKDLCRSKLTGSSLADWEKSLFDFIQKWLVQEQSFIEVKTSGSTGKPKTIQLDKNKMVTSAKITLEHLQISKDQNALLCLSCNYIAGKMMVVRAFAGGLNLITVAPSNNPLMHIRENIKIDFTAWVPFQLQNALHQSLDKKIQEIQNILIGSAPLNYALRKKVKGFSNDIYETYGMTETISHIALKHLSNNVQDDYFTTLDNISIAQDERDCLIINAPHYSPTPIITNDLVEIKDEKHFKWLGRFDNVVNSAGIKLIPEILEKKVERLFEKRFFFAGLPDEKLGDKLVLVVERKKISRSALENLKLALTSMLSKYEIPKEIFFVEQFTETANRKINRKETLNNL